VPESNACRGRNIATPTLQMVVVAICPCAAPELTNLALFATGFVSLADHGLMRLRAQRRQSTPWTNDYVH
jgi:hypothetical protein